MAIESFFTQTATIKRNAQVLGEYNRPRHSLVVIGQTRGVLDAKNTNVMQAQPQSELALSMTWFCLPDADIKPNDVLVIEGTTYKAFAPIAYETHLEVSVSASVEL